jgi:NTP pyrophosphatase (non-canonical NTP hydrolase)
MSIQKRSPQMNIRFLGELAWQWGMRCFGINHMRDSKVRGLRAAEEMIELCQVLEVDSSKLHNLIDVVYSRPVGDVYKELGGVMLTTMVLAHGLFINLEECTEDELLRVLEKSPDYFKQRNQQKIDLGLS